MAIRRFRREDLENQLNRSALWAVTYGDMMSYLMILFLLMFSFSLAKNHEGAAADRGYEQSLANIQKAFGGSANTAGLDHAVQHEREEMMADQIREDVNKRDLSKFAKVETVDKKVRLILADGVLFDSGQAQLKPQALALLGAVADEMKRMNNQIVVEGHTDNVPVRSGRYASNWELSMARAYSVVHFLEQHGVASSRLAGIGYGEHRPAAGNADAVGRAKNRRIEIDLLRE